MTENDRIALSQLAARKVESEVMETLQAADEIGGPDWREYAEMMDRLAAVCKLRAETAREQHGPAYVIRWLASKLPEGRTVEEMHTGGGCTGISVSVCGGSDAYWLITDVGGATAPTSLHEPVQLGLYWDARVDGENTGPSQWLGWELRNVMEAAHIIRRLNSHSELPMVCEEYETPEGEEIE